MAERIMGSPELTLEMERLAIEREKMHFDLEASRLAADTAKLEIVNATMRAEAGSDDKWQKRWRPYWGFVSGTAWGIIALSMAVLIGCIAFSVKGVDVGTIVQVGKAVGEMDMFWLIALTVLGVTTWTRGQEKKERLKARGTVLTSIIE